MTPEHLLDLCRGASDAGPNGTRGALIAACSPERIAALAELWKAVEKQDSVEATLSDEVRNALATLAKLTEEK